MGTYLGTHCPRSGAVWGGKSWRLPRYHERMKSFLALLAIVALGLWSIRAAFFVWLFGCGLVLLILLLLLICTPRR